MTQGDDESVIRHTHAGQGASMKNTQSILGKGQLVLDVNKNLLKKMENQSIGIHHVMMPLRMLPPMPAKE